MSVFGDGSDGALNVTSGTTNLALNRKYQFTTVNVAAGATLSSNTSTGAVLYILARESITINGTIDVRGVVNRGNNTWPVTIDGVRYESPGVAPGDYWNGRTQPMNGYGSGGASYWVDDTKGGQGGPGGANPIGGAGRVASRSSTNTGDQYVSGLDGTQSGGASGAAWAHVSGSSSGVVVTARSGAGASTHGGNGGNGSGEYVRGSSGSWRYGWYAGGGGGGGGLAGRAGVAVVLKAPVIVLNGQIITAGTDGGNGGNGGRARSHAGWEDLWGYPGLGGGGGHGGMVYFYRSKSLDFTGDIGDHLSQEGGTGGLNGRGYNDNQLGLRRGKNGVQGNWNSFNITDPSEYATLLSNLGGIAPVAEVGGLLISVESVDFNKVGGIAPVAAVGGLKIKRNMTALAGIAPVAEVGDVLIDQQPPPPPPPTDWSAVGKLDDKFYLYKISKSDGSYVGVWVDVADDLEFTERINTAGTSTTVRLARSANTTREMRASLLTQGGDYMTTEDGAKLVSVYETPNTVGEGTDVELNYNVDIYVHYGEFARLVTQLGEPIVTQAGDNIMVVSGAPLGTRVFSGYVLDYDASYGEESSVWVTVVSHGNELSDQEVLDGNKTNVRFSGQELSAITKDILDTNPGRMSYEEATLPNTGVTQTLDFQLNTKLEAIQSIYDQTPDGWYWYGDVAENLVHMRPVSEGYDHTFIIGRHVKSIRIRRSMEGLKNRVYFVGGQTDPNDAATTKFKKYENVDSQDQWRVGLERITDRRYTVDSSMRARGDKVLTSGAAPVFTTSVTITSGRYDLESVRIGQTVGFKNSGNYIDGIPPLQIVSRTYTPTELTLELGALLERQVDTLSKTEKSLNNEQFNNIPDLPS